MFTIEFFLNKPQYIRNEPYLLILEDPHKKASVSSRQITVESVDNSEAENDEVFESHKSLNSSEKKISTFSLA